MRRPSIASLVLCDEIFIETAEKYMTGLEEYKLLYPLVSVGKVEEKDIGVEC
jgi:hypothetical protein